MGRRGARWITTLGAVVIAVGTLLVTTELIRDIPIVVAYVG